MTRRRLHKRYGIDLGHGGPLQLVPVRLFYALLAEKKIVISPDNPKRASVAPDLYCWLDLETNELKFALKDTKLDRYAIGSSWQKVLEHAKYSLSPVQICAEDEE